MQNVQLRPGPRGLYEVVLNRPKVNALDLATLEALGAVFRDLAGREDARGVFLRAEGRTFSAGLDLAELLRERGRPHVERLVDALEEALTEAYALPVPMVTVVHGHAIAGGLVLALTADRIVLSAAPFRVGLTELQVGVPLPRAAFEIVNAGLPRSLAQRLLFDAELLAAEEAYVLGFGQARVEDATAAAVAWIDKVAARPREAFRIAKTMSRAPVLARLRERDPEERRAVVDAILTPESLAAMEAALGS